MPGLIIAAAIIVVIVISMLIMLKITLPIAKTQYENTFVRTSPDKWARTNSCPTNPEHTVMYEAGLAWAEPHMNNKTDISITNDELKLAGQYFDFGSKKAVIILSGRAEALEYSYYFAEPYEKLGCNILVIDGRAHGMSEGKYSGVGVLESEDVLKWAKLLHDEHGVEDIYIHGLCIGSSTAIFLAAKGIPFIRGIALEGPYISFFSVLKQRTLSGGHPTFPVVEEMSYLIYKNTGVNIFKSKPIKAIRNVTIPILFLCGKEDISSLPKYCLKLYDNCPSSEKKIVWFEHGAHSHLRIANTEKYDSEIIGFYNKALS